jgi:branched-subunit amino acid ABC-type transport system permease component
LRWKLLIITSLVAAVVGAASSYSLFNLLTHYSLPRLLFTKKLALAEICPLVTSCIAAIFVYRHTARRRKTQVLITLLLSLFLFQVLIYLALKIPPINLGVGD